MSERARILVVDDELGPRESLRMILNNRYEAVTVDSGEAAIEYMTSNPADVVLLDIRMPDMDGMETLRRIKQINPEVEVVMITAYASLNTAREAMKYEALDYVIKPFSVEAINKAVEKGLSRRRERLSSRRHMENLKDQMEALTRASSQIGSEQKLLAIISAIAKEGARIMGADGFTVCSLNGTGGQVVSVLCGDLSQELMETAVREYQAAVRRGEAKPAEPIVFYADRWNHSDWAVAVRDMILKEGYRSMLFLPLIYAQESLGVLAFGHRELRDYLRRELELAGTFANQVAAVLKNKRLYEDLEEKARELSQKVAQLSILRGISTAVLGNLDLNVMLESVTDGLKRLGYDYASISMLDEQQESGWTRERLKVECEPLEGQKGFRITSPIVVDDKATYMLEVHTRRRADKKELELIGMLSEYIAIAAKNSWLYREINKTKGYLESLINDAGDAIVAVSKDDAIVSWNSAAEQIFQFTRDDILGKSMDCLIPEEGYNRKKSLLLAFKQAQRFEAKGKRKDGATIDVEVILSPIKSTNGEIVGISAIIKDVTERKELERQLTYSEKQRALGIMSSGVIHNFNNILTVILGRAELLQMHIPKSEDNQRILDSINVLEKAAMDGAAIIRRIQEFTRKGEGKISTSVNLNELVKDSLILSKPKWKHEPEAKGTTIEVETELGDIPLINGDRTQLGEVLLNMIFNAVEAMPNGGNISVRTWQEGRAVCLSISDTGIGMPEEAKERVFDPFFTTKGVKGVGLGMSVVYGIVKRHNGQIDIDSTEGEGATFTIRFPVPEEAQKRPREESLTREVIPAKILLIEDEKPIRDLFGQMVEMAGHQVSLATSGSEGLEMLEKSEFDVVFTDLSMPGISGWQVVKRAREVDPKMPIAVCTGWGIEADQGLEGECEADFVVSKPFKIDAILDVVNKAVELKRKRNGIASNPSE